MLSRRTVSQQQLRFLLLFIASSLNGGAEFENDGQENARHENVQ